MLRGCPERVWPWLEIRGASCRCLQTEADSYTSLSRAWWSFKVLLSLWFYFFQKSFPFFFFKWAVNNNDISCIHFGVTVWTYSKYLVNLSCSSIAHINTLWWGQPLGFTLFFSCSSAYRSSLSFLSKPQQFFFMSFYFPSPAKFHPLSQSSTLYLCLLQTAIL